MPRPEVLQALEKVSATLWPGGTTTEKLMSIFGGPSAGSTVARRKRGPSVKAGAGCSAKKIWARATPGAAASSSAVSTHARRIIRRA